MFISRLLSKQKLLKAIVRIMIYYSFLMTGNVAFCQDTPNSLRVATKNFPPFAFEQHGHYVGFSIDLWDEIAKELNVTSQLYGEPTLVALLDSVSNGDTDIGIAGITITQQREKKLDFSHSFFESGLQILVSSGNVSPWQTFFAFLFSPILWSAILFLLFVIAIAAHIIWFCERNKNPGMFPKSYLEGIGESLWWAVVTVVTVGYGDKTPLGVMGRIVATIWMFTGILLLSYFTASVTSALTVRQLQQNITSIQDLHNQSIGTVRKTTAAEFLETIPAYVILFDTIEDAYEALDEGTIKAIVYDGPALRYYMKGEGQGKVQLVGAMFAQQSYGIALQTNSPYREPINQAILKLKEDGTYQRIYEKWFGAN